MAPSQHVGLWVMAAFSCYLFGSLVGKSTNISAINWLPSGVSSPRQVHLAHPSALRHGIAKSKPTHHSLMVDISSMNGNSAQTLMKTSSQLSAIPVSEYAQVTTPLFIAVVCAGLIASLSLVKRHIAAHKIPDTSVLQPLPKYMGLMLTTASLCAQSAMAVKLDLAEAAKLEPDPEIALELWDAAIDSATKPTAALLMGRANANLLLGRWAEAEVDFTEAIALMPSEKGDVLALKDTEVSDALNASLAWDGKGIAEAKQGKWDEALGSFQQALGRVGLAGVGDAPVPNGTPFSGLRGGAPTMLQRIELNRALALAGAGEFKDAVAALRLIDKGPSPNGFPQFWDARAALAISLSAAGQPKSAELEWTDLCRATPPPPPATPTNPIFSQVNKAAQMMLDAQGILYDQNCEDFTTGVYIPCDDAGIPGLGGSSSPCSLYTTEEVQLRLWPPTLVQELAKFLRQDATTVASLTN